MVVLHVYCDSERDAGGWVVQNWQFQRDVIIEQLFRSFIRLFIILMNNTALSPLSLTVSNTFKAHSMDRIPGIASLTNTSHSFHRTKFQSKQFKNS